MPNRDIVRPLLQAKRALDEALFQVMGVGIDNDDSDDSDDTRGFSRSGRRGESNGDDNRGKQRGRGKGRVTNPENDKRVKNAEQYDQ